MNASKGSGAMGGGGGRGKEEGPYEMKDSLVWDGFEKDGVLTASLAENFQSLLLKSPDEIERFSVKENLSEIERALTLHTSGTTLQKLSVLNNLPNLFRDYKREAIDKLLPKICNIAPKTEREYQVAAARALENLLKEKLLHTKAVTDQILPLALKLLRHRDEGAVPADEWTDVLVAAMPLLSMETLKEKVVPFSRTLAELSQPVSNRLLACRLLGSLAQYLDGPTVESQYLRMAMELCQDTDYEVRARMAAQLEPIARAVDLHAAKTHHLLRELLELLSDEEAMVKRAALTTFVSLLEFYDSETRAETMIPLMKSYCRITPEELAPTLAARFGEVLGRIIEFLDDEEVVQMFGCYRTLARHRSAELRKSAAENFPQVMRHVGVKRFTAFMHEPLQQLSMDESWQVRRAAALVYPVVLEALGKDKAVDLKDLFVAFLRDSNPEVKDAILDNIATIMGAFGCAHRDRRAATYASLVGPLLECHASVARNWRLQQRLVTQFANLHMYLSPQSVTDKFIPLLHGLMTHTHVPPVREAAAVALCRLIRWSLRSPQKRRELCSKLIEEYAKGKSYWDRLLFIHFATAMAAVFSRRFFKENLFFDSVLDMATDPVPNVRMRMCGLLPTLKRMIKLPDDAPLLKKFSTHIIHLKNDKDRDVSIVATQTAEKLASIETGRASDAECEDDILDFKKEEEEEMMFRMEEKEIEENKKRDEEVRSEFRRKLEQNEAEKVLRAKHTNKPKHKDEPVTIKTTFPPTNSLNSSKQMLSPSASLQPPPPFLPSLSPPPGASSPTSLANGRPPRTRVVSATNNAKPAASGVTVTSTMYLRRGSDPVPPKINVKTSTLSPLSTTITTPTRERSTSLLSPTKISTPSFVTTSPVPITTSTSTSMSSLSPALTSSPKKNAPVPISVSPKSRSQSASSLIATKHKNKLSL